MVFYTPKELQLLKFVRARLKAGRKVGIYATYTGKLGTLQRLQMLLEERGIRTAVLEANVDGPEREEWIAKREAEGIQVLLTNPILVSTGLDLLNFPSLYFYQTGHRLSIVRQASRRHWRIGQNNVCETVYSGYKGTMQDLAINLMASKMGAALALEGQFSQEGLAALTEGSGGSLANELAKRFVGNKIEGVESAESIWGKMSMDTSQFIASNTAPIVHNLSNDSEEKEQVEVFNQSKVSEIGNDVFSGETLEVALLKWASESIPGDLYNRFEQQIEYVVDNVQSDIDGLTVSRDSLLGEYDLRWSPLAVPTNSAEFRRWVFNLTNKRVEHQVEVSEDWTLELLVEGKSIKTKTKKTYNVSTGQVAFNF